MMNINLHWTELNHIATIDYDQEDKGVYVWGFMFDDTFIPYYVGNAYNIQTRLTEHASAILGGRYCIIHKDNLAAFYDYKETKIPTKDSGLLYYPNFPEGYKSFLNNWATLYPHITNMIDRMHYSFASFNDASITKKHLEQIENKCISTIGKDRLWNRKCGSCDDVTVTNVTGDPQILAVFNR